MTSGVEAALVGPCVPRIGWPSVAPAPGPLQSHLRAPAGRPTIAWRVPCANRWITVTGHRSNAINPFDRLVMTYLNEFARKSWVFDQMVAFLSVNNLFKGGALMLLVWWAWFRTEGRSTKERGHIIATIFSCAVALAVGRIMVILLPFRVRPLHEVGLHFVPPYGVSEEALAKLSSFPSDHAVLFLALVTGLFFISSAIGACALLYTMVVIILPRMYLGLHYPTDVLGGALVGVVFAWLGNVNLPRTRVISFVENLAWRKPMYFYPALFLVTYQIADLFESSRALVGGLFKLAGSLLGSHGLN